MGVSGIIVFIYPNCGHMISQVLIQIYYIYIYLFISAQDGHLPGPMFDAIRHASLWP